MLSAKANDLFCLNCEAILPFPEVANCTIRCVVCNAIKHIDANQIQLIDRQERSYVRTVADTEASALSTQDEVIQVEHVCPKCGYALASYVTQQTRSADEGQTVFYTCLQCKYRCIEYS